VTQANPGKHWTPENTGHPLFQILGTHFFIDLFWLIP